MVLTNIPPLFVEVSHSQKLAVLLSVSVRQVHRCMAVCFLLLHGLVSVDDDERGFIRTPFREEIPPPPKNYKSSSRKTGRGKYTNQRDRKLVVVFCQ